MFSQEKLITVRAKHTFLWYNLALKLADSKWGLWCPRKDSPAIISPRVHDCQTPGTSSSRELPWGLVPQRLKLPQDNSCLTGIFAAQALIQSKITDPGQVFLLLLCLFYLLKSPHVSAMKCFQQLHDQRGIAIDTCPDKSSTSVSSLVSSLGDLGDLGHGTLEGISSRSSPSPWIAGQCQRRTY